MQRLGADTERSPPPVSIRESASADLPACRPLLAAPQRVQLRDAQRPGAPSRGALPVDFVTSEAGAEAFLEGLDREVGPAQLHSHAWVLRQHAIRPRAAACSRQQLGGQAELRVAGNGTQPSAGILTPPPHPPTPPTPTHTHTHTHTRARHHVTHTTHHPQAYPGFNLVGIDLREGSMLYLCNKRGGQVARLPPGLHGVTNGQMYPRWPKVRLGREQGRAERGMAAFTVDHKSTWSEQWAAPGWLEESQAGRVLGAL